MARPTRETEPRRGEKPSDSGIGFRPLGLIGAYGFHPDTRPPHEKPDASKPAHSGHNPLDDYPQGFFSIVRSVWDEASRSSTGVNQLTALNPGKQAHPLQLVPRIERLRDDALRTQQEGREEEANLFNTDAATEASAVFDSGEAFDIQTRAQHAITAVVAFIDAGKIADARTLAKRVSEDQSIPQVYKDMVSKAIEVEGSS